MCSYKYTCGCCVNISSLYIITQVVANGVLCFEDDFKGFCGGIYPKEFPHVGNKIIAPFWADIDLRCTGRLYYRQEDSVELLQRASNDVGSAFPGTNFDASSLFIATWRRAGYHNCHRDKVYEFFLLHVCSSTYSVFSMRYN